MAGEIPTENLHDYCLKLGLQHRDDNNDRTKMAEETTSLTSFEDEQTEDNGQPIPAGTAKINNLRKSVSKNISRNNFDCKNCGKGFANSRQFLKHRCSSYSVPDTLSKPKRKARSKKSPGKCLKTAKTPDKETNDDKGAAQVGEMQGGPKPNSTGETQVDEESREAVIHLADHTYVRDDSDPEEGHASTSEKTLLKGTNKGQIQCDPLVALPGTVSENKYKNFQDLPHEKYNEVTSPNEASKPNSPVGNDGNSGDNPEPGSKRKYVFKREEDFCPNCKKGFHSEKRLQKHLKVCGKNLVCEFCGEDFNSCGKLAYSKYEKHYYTHVEKKPFPCDQCSQSFVRKQDLDRHRVIHPEHYVPQTCMECGAVFSNEDLLRKHAKKHERPLWTCNKCKQNFFRQVIYEKHVAACQTQISCEVCGKVFQCLSKNLKSRYQEHMFTHTGEKPYKCQFCERAFRDRSTRKKHERSHTGEKPYPCTICDRAFSQLRLLRNHIRTHTGEKPYQCDLCELAFAKQCNLKYHMRVHTKEKPYTCLICNKSFTQSGTYHKHMRRHICNQGADVLSAVNIVAPAIGNAGNAPEAAGNTVIDAGQNSPEEVDTSNELSNSEVTPVMAAQLETSTSAQVIQEIPISGDEITIIVSEGSVGVDSGTPAIATIDVEQISSLLASCP